MIKFNQMCKKWISSLYNINSLKKVNLYRVTQVMSCASPTRELYLTRVGENSDLSRDLTQSKIQVVS